MVLHSRLYGTNFAALDWNYGRVSLDTVANPVWQAFLYLPNVLRMYVTIIRTKFNNKEGNLQPPVIFSSWSLAPAVPSNLPPLSPLARSFAVTQRPTRLASQGRRGA